MNLANKRLDPTSQHQFTMKSRKALATALLLGLGAVGPASAIVISSSVSDNDYRTLAQNYGSVGQIYGTDSGGGFAASGVLIADRWVLTAAHVTSGASSLKFYLDGGGTNFSDPARASYAADQIYTYSKWDGNLGSGYDIGLFRLSDSIACTGCIAQRYTGTNEVGGIGTMVGFGMKGTGTTGATTFDGIKRAGQNVVDAVLSTPGRTNRVLLADFDSGLSSDNNFGSSYRLDLEALIAPGDSGGGLFQTFDQEYLVGIASFGWGRLDGDPNSDYGDVGGWTRVTYFNDWIDSIIGSGSTNTGGGGGNKRPKQLAFDLQAASVNVPEPGILALLCLGLGGLGLARRRRR